MRDFTPKNLAVMVYVMRIAELTGGPAVDELYREILVPCFPPAERASLEGVRYLAGAGGGLVWAAFDERGDVAGCAVGEWDAEPGLLLLVLHADERFAGPGAGTIDGTVLREYIELYQRECEGQVATDEQAARLFEAIDRPGGVPLLSPGERGTWAPAR
jgi:hypothetical protein